MDINNQIKHNPNSLSEWLKQFQCPICGNYDIDIYAIRMTGNYYICKTTHTILDMKVRTETYFEKSQIQDREFLRNNP